MTKLYLIRHAEAEGNLYRRAQGQYDANITLLGRRQVAALAERFRDVHLDALWASDLIRTQSTASALLKYHPDLTLHTDPALREVDVGCWEDHAWAEISAKYLEQHWLFTHDPAKWHVPGSEDYEAVWRRVRGALLALADAYPGKTVAVVSHAFAIRAAAAHLMGKGFAEIPYGDNTAVTTLRAEDGAPLPGGGAGSVKRYFVMGSGMTPLGKFTFTRPGTFVYTIHEVAGGGANWVYNTAQYVLTFEVTAQNGKLETRYVLARDGERADRLVFRNRYDPPASSR